MINKFKLPLSSFLGFVMLCLQTEAQSINQNIQTRPILFEGVIVGGYVDQGAYINCAGPGVKFSKKPLSLLLGLLPGLRIKDDKTASGTPKNATITPSLGFGLTATHKHLALQLPFYYNAKTPIKNGEWKPGIGIGYKF